MNALLQHPGITRTVAPVILIYFVAEWLWGSGMPAALVLTGLAVTVTAAALAARRVISAPPAALLAAAGIALALTGVVTDHATRGSLDSAFTLLGAAGIFLIGVEPKCSVLLRFLLITAGLAALLGLLVSVSGQAASVDAAGTALLATYPVLVSILVLGWWYRRGADVAHIDEADEVSV